MNKIPTLFVRDENDRAHVTHEPHPDCLWVFAGEGTATRKYDGTCVMFDGERWWARREVKPGKTEPDGFRLVTFDALTGKSMGWEPVEQSSFAKAHAEAVAHQNTTVSGWPHGTYELVGPKVQGNPERVAQHELWAHAAAEVMQVSGLDWDALRATVLAAHAEDGCEGIVWHHPDGRMAKLKARDFPQ